MFSAVDALPKGSLTISFKFRLFARRLPNGVNVVAVKFANLLAFSSTATGKAMACELDNEGFDLPTPGGYSSGWHRVMVSFDSVTGALQAYFDGQLGVNKTGFKRGKSLAGTFGPGSFLPRRALGRGRLSGSQSKWSAQVESRRFWCRRTASLSLTMTTI